MLLGIFEKQLSTKPTNQLETEANLKLRRCIAKHYFWFPWLYSLLPVLWSTVPMIFATKLPVHRFWKTNASTVVKKANSCICHMEECVDVVHIAWESSVSFIPKQLINRKTENCFFYILTEENQDCSITMILGPIKKAKCIDGTKCDFVTRKCIKE